MTGARHRRRALNSFRRKLMQNKVLFSAVETLDFPQIFRNLFEAKQNKYFQIRIPLRFILKSKNGAICANSLKQKMLEKLLELLEYERDRFDSSSSAGE